MNFPWLLPLCVLLLGYGLGSIPFGLLLTRLTGAGDLRQIMQQVRGDPGPLQSFCLSDSS